MLSHFIVLSHLSGDQLYGTGKPISPSLPYLPQPSVKSDTISVSWVGYGKTCCATLASNQPPLGAYASALTILLCASPSVCTEEASEIMVTGQLP